MAEQLRQLIDKIQQEGVKAAEQKANAIEEEASRRAQEVVAEARRKAEGLWQEAQDRIRRQEENTKTTLQQAARDVFLALRAEIEGMLEKIVAARVREALKPEEMARMIAAVAKEHRGEAPVVSMKKEDLEKLEKSFLAELKSQVQAGITLRAADDIRGGFTISFDKGRSAFDFTDKALGEYICQQLRPKLKEILGDIPDPKTS